MEAKQDYSLMGETQPSAYRGRLAPTPTGHLHLGHARTFWTAQERAKAHGGVIILRNEDLDEARCKAEYVEAMYEDLGWFGFSWKEGPDIGGPHAPYNQSERLPRYQAAWARLRDAGVIYPSPHSRKDVEAALRAPHEGETEAIFPTALRPKEGAGLNAAEPDDVNWRFRVPDGKAIIFEDINIGSISYTAGRDFGDFIIWRKDGFPSYELAVVADDAEMRISEVVRGEDLLLSTARQLLLYEALGWKPPAFYHCPLIRDENGKRLAKRHDALSLQHFRETGTTPDELRSNW